MHHYNLLLIWNRSWILTVHKVRILRKMLPKKTFLVFKNGVTSIQTAGYNGVRTVYLNTEEYTAWHAHFLIGNNGFAFYHHYSQIFTFFYTSAVMQKVKKFGGASSNM